MLRGLVIRQFLVLTDVVLALMIAYLIFLIAFGPSASSGMVSDLPIPQPGESQFHVAKVGPRAEYDGIVTGGMFGAGAADAPPSAPSEESTALVQTTAPLKLYGTVATHPSDPYATAIIENSSPTATQRVATYYNGKEVMPNLRLVEVHRRRIILRNEEKNQNEELVMEEPKSAGPVNPGDPRLARGGRRDGAVGATNPPHAALNRDQVVEELNQYSYADLVASLNPELYTDENGNVAGITSQNFSSVPLAQRVGLQNGDVVQTVNGVTIDSEEKIGEIAQKFGNANTFRVGILRNGKPQMITFRLE